MTELPGGTVTLLFTDIEGSTRLLQELGRDGYVQALEDHRRILREAFARHGGVEVEMQGDSFHFAFAHARDAVAAATEAQRALVESDWGSRPIRVRIGMHTGEPLVTGNLYAGLDVHRAARVMGAGHGGQVLLSETSRAVLEGELPAGVALRDLGEHRLKDLPAPQRLYQLLADGLAVEFPPLNALHQTNLPAPPTPFLGRERELAEVCALLAEPDVRLVTLTGPGGTGKTRLALALAERLEPSFAGGAAFVQLASVADPELVPSTVAAALGVVPGADPAEAVLAHLAGREFLLVVDNLEHLLASGPFLAQLVASAPSLKLLVTSRAPLRVRAEHGYPVPPLVEAEGVELFIASARAQEPDVDVDTDVARAIVRRLDALPLAVELAAARVPLLGAAGLLDRLDEALPLLTAGSRDAPARQQTLRATIEWSDRLLGEEERVLLARLSVFAGGFTLEAAEAVCDARMDGLQALVEHALIRRVADAAVPRFRMLHVIREHAAEQLETGHEANDVRRRHADWHLALAEQALTEMRRGPKHVWLPRLETERDNFRAALSFFLAVDDVEAGLRAAAALFWLWLLGGYSAEGSRWLERGLAKPDLPAGLRARALDCSAQLALLVQGSQVGEARGRLEEALGLYQSVEDDEGAALVLQWLGAVAVEDGDHERAVELHEQSLQLTRQAGNPFAAAGITLNLADTLLLVGDYDGAHAAAKDALAAFRELDEAHGATVALMNAALADLARGRWQHAAPRVREALELVRSLDFRQQEIYCTEALAAIAVQRGDTDTAARLLGNAAALRESVDIELEAVERALHERTLAATREAVGGVRFLELEEEGRSLPADFVDAYADTVNSDGAQAAESRSRFGLALSRRISRRCG